ncbi:MAG: hypothetical protein ACRDPO_11615, partial [Streptosporangiaceae bacterium]
GYRRYPGRWLSRPARQPIAMLAATGGERGQTHHRARLALNPWALIAACQAGRPYITTLILTASPRHG